MIYYRGNVIFQQRLDPSKNYASLVTGAPIVLLFFSQICIAQLVIRLTNIMFVFLILVKSSFCILAFILCVCMFIVPSFLILFEEIYLTIILSSLTIIFFILLFLQLYKPCNKLLRKGRKRVVKCVVLQMAMISFFFLFSLFVSNTRGVFVLF